MVREYQADGYELVEDPKVPGALALQKDGKTIYIKTEKSHAGVSFLSRSKV